MSYKEENKCTVSSENYQNVIYTQRRLKNVSAKMFYKNKKDEDHRLKILSNNEMN